MTDRITDLIAKHGYKDTAIIISGEAVDNLDNIYVAGDIYLRHLRSTSMGGMDLLLKYKSRFTTSVHSFMVDNYDTLASWIVEGRSEGFKYSSIKDIATNYLVKDGDTVVEDIQWLWMRVAAQVAMPNMDDVRDTYNLLSLRKAIHATPTCINAGMRANNSDLSQLESCFLISMGDSMDSISWNKRLFVLGSKNNAGFGIDVRHLRSSSVADRGMSCGKQGVIKTIDADREICNQLGSRPAAVAVYNDIDDVEIRTFMRMKDKNSSVQATGVNYAVVISDLFMRRKERGEKWSLFCPRHTKKLYLRLQGGDDTDSSAVDNARSLRDMWGKEYEDFYTVCEESGIASEVVDANTLWMELCTLRSTVGSPFIMFRDNVNRKSNHKHLGTITQSNLCTEIVQYTDPDSGASCTLAAISLPEYLIDGKRVDWLELGRAARLLTRNLNKVIDRTSGILPGGVSRLIEQHKDHPLTKVVGTDPAHIGRMKHRAIGLGVMGLASLLSLMELEYGSSEAMRLGACIRACVYYHSVDESVSIAEKDGPCESWYGSPLSEGILHHDMYASECEQLGRRSFKEIDTSDFCVTTSWDHLRDRVRLGTRNSLFTCQMPNSTTSSIFGVSPGQEPMFGVLYSTSSADRTSMDVYDSFKTVMVRNGLYDPVSLAKFLKNNKGSIDGLERIYPNVDVEKVSHIKRVFKSAFSVNKKKMLQAYSWMGVYIDQAQSTNIFYDKPNSSYLSDIQTTAWEEGAKTLYYVHRTTSDKISLQSNKEEEEEVCPMTEGCLWCE